MKRIVFSAHARAQLDLRGATEAEARMAIQEGERLPAKRGRTAFRKNVPFRSEWKGSYYETKQIMPVAVEENDTIIVVTVYVFYFGGSL